MYVVNKSVERTHRITYDGHRDKYLRLDLNENPGGLPQDFVDAILSDVTPEFISQYPDMVEFTSVYSEFLGVKPENLCLVNGSSEGIRYVIEGFTAPAGEIVCVSPSYAMYEVYASLYDRVFKPVFYDDDLTMPIGRLIESISPATQLLILLNPNNPIGNVYSDAEMRQIMQAASDNDVTVLIDEAYHYIYPNTFLNYALEYPRVFVARTFSKLFSLAGCRLGCIIGHPNDVKIVQKLCTPHNVNAFAMLFAQAVIQHPNLLKRLVEGQIDGKTYLVNEFERRGYDYLPSHGNFMFFKPHIDAAKLVELMKSEKHILVKSYKGIGSFGQCVRVTTAERIYMERFITALDELDCE